MLLFYKRIIMVNTLKKSEGEKKSIFWNVLKTAALAAILTSCWWDINDITFDNTDKSVKFEMQFNGSDEVHYDITIKQENDSTYYGLIDWGFFHEKEIRRNTPEAVFEEVTDEVCDNVSRAQISSIEKITELEINAQNKIKYIQKQYKKMLEENDPNLKEQTITYQP